MSDQKRVLTMEDIEDMVIMGYPMKDLLIFADACRMRGIEDWQMHDFADTARNAFNYALDVVKGVKRV